MSPSPPPPPPPQVAPGTLEVGQVALQLGFTSSWIRQLLDDPASPLTGPPSLGRGHPRFVYTASVAAYISASTADRNEALAMLAAGAAVPAAEDGSALALRLGRIQTTVSLLLERDHEASRLVEVLQDQNADLRSQVADLRFAILQINEAAVALRSAAEAESRAFEFQAQALVEHRKANDSVRLGEKAREAALAPFLIDSHVGAAEGHKK